MFVEDAARKCRLLLGGEQLEERAHERVVLRKRPGGVGPADVQQAFGRVLAGRLEYPARRPLAHGRDGRFEHRFAVGEVLVERPAGDSGGFRDARDGGSLDAVLCRAAGWWRRRSLAGDRPSSFSRALACFFGSLRICRFSDIVRKPGCLTVLVERAFRITASRDRGHHRRDRGVD